MDPRRVLLLRDTVRAGSISAAARALGWTQPALSQHLQALERETGTPLLLRGPRGVEPTEAGRLLLARADAVAGELHMAGEEIADLTRLRRGRVRLAAYPSASATVVPGALAALRAEHPGVDVALVEAEPPQALALVEAGDVDLALVFDYGAQEPDGSRLGLTRTPLGEEPVRLVLPPGSPASLRSAGPRNRDRLAHQAWVAGCERCREHLVARAAAAGWEPVVRHTTDDYVVVQHLVAAGLGVALLPATALAAYRHPDVVLGEHPGWGARRYGVAHRPGADAVPATAALLHRLHAVVDADPSGSAVAAETAPA